MEALPDIAPPRTGVRGFSQWGMQPLHLAAYNGRRQAARTLLKAGARVNARDYVRRIPVVASMRLLRSGRAHRPPWLTGGTHSRGPNTCCLAPCHLPGPQASLTPLHRAVMHGHQGVVRELLQSGARANKPTVVRVLRSSARGRLFLLGHPRVADTLIEHGKAALAQKCAPPSQDGRTALHVALGGPSSSTTRILQLLLEAGADPCRPDVVSHGTAAPYRMLTSAHKAAVQPSRKQRGGLHGSESGTVVLTSAPRRSTGKRQGSWPRHWHIASFLEAAGSGAGGSLRGGRLTSAARSRA